MTIKPSTDRRPWLIISQREAQALELVCREVPREARSADLRRALVVISRQLLWLEGSNEGQEPTREAAVKRDG